MEGGRGSKRLKAFVTAALLCVAASVLIARRNLVTSYEPSIYAGTPIAYWVLYTAAILLCLTVIFGAQQDGWRYTAAGVLACAMLTVVLLPIIRGYWLVEYGDPLTVIGFLRDSVGQGSPFNHIYPALIALPIILARLLHVPWNQALLYLAPIFFAVFVISIPLLLRRLNYSSNVVLAGVFFALFMLPINLIATALYPIMNSMMALYAGFVLFSVTIYLTTDQKWASGLPLVVLVAAVLLHPQQTLFLVSVIVTISILQLLLQDHSNKMRIRRTTALMVFFGVAWAFWIILQEGFGQHITLTIIRVLTQEISATGGRDVSFSEVGVSLPEMALRLFAVDILVLGYIVLAGLVNTAWLLSELGVLNREFMRHQTGLQSFFGAGIALSAIPVTVMFLFFFASGRATQYLRVVAFLMVLGTILGPIGAYQSYHLLESRANPRALKSVVIVVLMVCLALSTLTYHPSPFIQRDSKHVTQASVQGFDTMFTYDDHDGNMIDNRVKVRRFAEAREGAIGAPQTKYIGSLRSEPLPEHFANQSLPEHYPEDKQLVITASDRYLDADLYGGFRLSKEDFYYLEIQPGIEKQYDNGDVTWYHIQVNRSESAEPT